MDVMDRIISIIYKTIDETNEFLAPEKQLEKSPDIILFGQSGHLDSMGLVNFIITLEEMLKEEFSINIVLADERAMSQKNSPFRTVSSFADYILILLEESKNG